MPHIISGILISFRVYALTKGYWTFWMLLKWTKPSRAFAFACLAGHKKSHLGTSWETVRPMGNSTSRRKISQQRFLPTKPRMSEDYRSRFLRIFSETRMLGLLAAVLSQTLNPNVLNRGVEPELLAQSLSKMLELPVCEGLVLLRLGFG